jgi:hypothetical protein
MLPPNIAKFGEVALVEITCLVSPFAQLASILKSSPAPLGMFLICNAAMTEPPHFVSGCPLISEKLVGSEREAHGARRSRCGVEDVVGSVDLVRRSGNLEQTPSLIEADSADNVRSMNAGIGVGNGTGRAHAHGQVGDSGAVERDRIIETYGARYAVAELGGVLDVVHAGNSVMTAEQERGIVARIPVPGRRIAGGRFTEGEARTARTSNQRQYNLRQVG